VVPNAFKGEDLNKYLPIFQKENIPVRYNFRDEDMKWIHYTPKAKMITRFSWAGFAFLLLAVFTKESALPVLAGVAIYSVWVKRKWFFAAAVSILGSWAGMRLLDFRSISGGVYALGNSSGVGHTLYLAGRSLSFLPVTRLNFQQIYASVPSASLGRLCFFLFGFCNLLVWILFALLAFRNRTDFLPLPRTGSIVRALTTRDKLLLLGMFSLILSIGYLALVGSATRFSFVFYTCLLLTLLALDTNEWKANWIWAVLILASAALSLSAFATSYSASSAAGSDSENHCCRKYTRNMIARPTGLRPVSPFE
jgi:hypothetical protein